MKIANGDRVGPHVHQHTGAGYSEAHCGADSGSDSVIAGEREQIDGFLRGHRHVERRKQRAARRERERRQRAGQNEQPELFRQGGAPSATRATVAVAARWSWRHVSRVSVMGCGDYIVKQRVAHRVGLHDQSEAVERCHPNSAAIIPTLPLRGVLAYQDTIVRQLAAGAGVQMCAPTFPTP